MDNIEDIYDLSLHERQNLMEILTAELFDIAGEIYGIRNGGCSCNRTVHSIEIDQYQNVTVHRVIYDGHDSRDDEEEFPLSFLWDDDCLAKEDKRIRQHNLDAIKKQIEKEKREKEESARAEEELYLTLKKKYEPVDLN